MFSVILERREEGRVAETSELKCTATVWRKCKTLYCHLRKHFNVTAASIMAKSKARQKRAANAATARAALARSQQTSDCLAGSTSHEHDPPAFPSEVLVSPPSEELLSEDGSDQPAEPQPTASSYLFDWPEWEDSEDNNDTPDLDDVTPDERDEAARAIDDTGLAWYSGWMQEAQETLGTMDEARQNKKRKRIYFGNSRTSQWRHVKAKIKLEEQGFQGLREYMVAMKIKVSQ
jgi:hypothetical protein